MNGDGPTTSETNPEQNRPPSTSGPAGARRWALPIALAVVHLVLLAIPAHQHVIGTYQTETDFYQYYAPDSERLAAWQFPECPYQAPGYAALVALASAVTHDPLTSGIWISIVSAVLVGLLTFVLLSRMYGYWVGVAAQALVPTIGAMPLVSISAMTDLPFLALCLATLIVVTGGRSYPLARSIVAGALAGAAYLVRYNGVFLVVACAAGIAALDLFDRPLSQRLRLAAVALAAFTLTASPWLYANYTHRGSPFYNLNYLNVAIEFYDGEISQDGTRAMATRFHSLRDVILEDPARIATRYPANVASSVAKSLTVLVSPWIGLAGMLGLILVLARRPSKPVLLLLGSGVLYMLMMGLSHWEMRYYLFVLVICVGLACHALALVVEAALARGWLPRAVAAMLSVAAVAILWASFTAQARANVADLLGSQPVQLFDARRFIDQAGGAGGRILTRKPHLPYISRSEWVFLPKVASVDELRVWLDANPVDYLLIGPFEVETRPALAVLRDPRAAPPWLRPVWVSADGTYVLYTPVAPGGP